MHPGTIQLDGDTAVGRSYMAERAPSRRQLAPVLRRVPRPLPARARRLEVTERVYEVRYLDTTPPAGWRPNQRPSPRANNDRHRTERLTTSHRNLTIRGVIKPVTVDFELIGVENDRRSTSRVRFEGSTTINRKDWGVHWRAAAGWSAEGDTGVRRRRHPAVLTDGPVTADHRRARRRQPEHRAHVTESPRSLGVQMSSAAAGDLPS